MKDPASFVAVADTMVKKLKEGLFPNMGSEKDPAYNSVDASLWFIRALQQMADYDPEYDIWNKYGKHIKNILKYYRQGTLYNIRMGDNGLIYAGVEGKALTWMDAIVDGIPVTPRMGAPVEVSALWYNAVSFSLELAEKAGDTKFIHELASLCMPKNKWPDANSIRLG